MRRINCSIGDQNCLKKLALKILYNFHRQHSLLKSIIKKVIAENQCEKHKNSCLVRMWILVKIGKVRTVVAATCIKI